ncbi:superoxide dismutase family protein [Sphingomonas sediminicola]|uniref:superoxide dismutase family protein n=1 Tax=Sphingomonas sediminicola TaxID=386874 RepID=UPI001FEAE5EB|nr:superoxide dismutase family protein [Sphingomonas sediminicola]
MRSDGPPDAVVATANLLDSNGAAIGTVRMFSEPTGIMLRINASGFPAGQHGVHLHSVGKCEAPKFTSAGPHWNPTEKKHGHRNPAGYHMGDLGNLGVGADGKLVVALLVPEATLDGIRDADGTALVLHAKADDEVTDPSGNSGDRIACAVL